MIKLILNVLTLILGTALTIGFFYILFWTSCAIVDHCYYNNIGVFQMFVLNQNNTDLAFNNAFNKGIFTKKQASDYDYIMYMCSDTDFDYFKSKLTKTKWKVKRV